jgi:hypothetical protein
MPTNLANTKTLFIPAINPPDGYVLTYSAFDGYYLPKPPALFNLANAGSSPYGATTEDVVVVPSHSGVFIVNLPVNPPPGKTMFIKDSAGVAAANNISVASAALLDGSGTYTINTNFGCIKVVFTGATWLILTKF